MAKQEAYEWLEEGGRQVIRCRCGANLLTDEYVCLRLEKGKVLIQNRELMLRMRYGHKADISGVCSNPKCRMHHQGITANFVYQNDMSETEARRFFEELGVPFKVFELGTKENPLELKGSSRSQRRHAEIKRRSALPPEIQDSLYRKDHEIRRGHYIKGGRDIGEYRSVIFEDDDSEEFSDPSPY